jgi:hypothetical protein
VHEHSANDGHRDTSLNRSAFQATTHCSTGCAIGEVLGMSIATALDWSSGRGHAVVHDLHAH